MLVVAGDGKEADDFAGHDYTSDSGLKIKICSLNVMNSKAVRKHFSYTNPVSCGGSKISLGLGDRLGLASPGHIGAIVDYDAFPILAQQSIRELNLTGRNYEEVLSDAVWAVFQEGYTYGFGADGDHLKTPEEVRMALGCGYTMITLDCSEHIDNKAAGYSEELTNEMYGRVPEAEREILEKKYLSGSIKLYSGLSIDFSGYDFKKTVLVYLKAIKFTVSIYNEIIRNCGRNIDFEMSIDETLTATSAEAHYFVASELIAGGVKISSLAPRFCGEFQKGIDYRGDKVCFEKEFAVHAEIARNFEYKISVHSGSDKFSIFPVVGRKTEGRYHLKTAGTNWLEAVRVIAAKDPELFRRMYRFAVQNLNEAKKYYHIFTETDMVPDEKSFEDADLDKLFGIEESRQALHVTYGLILNAKNEDGSSMFRDEFFKTMYENEELYSDFLRKHIGNHIKYLDVPRRKG
ncbi:MAG: tagaturonate epimerase family protein, partial [Eubacteriales bacterium]|nr:tagaturonate epimerase family protein [Eubacteriales bacterium]